MLLNTPVIQSAAGVSTAVQVFNGLSPGATVVGFSITPTDGSLWWGDSTLTTALGQPLAAGQTLTILTSSPNSFYIMAQSGTVNVRRVWYTNPYWGALA